MRVRVSARAGDAKSSKVSAAVGPVMRAAPSALAPPQVSGEPVVGTPLTANAGTWSDPGATFTFVWQRCDDTGVCTAIDGATGPTYTPGADDLGDSLRVEVTARNAGGTATVDSDPTGAVVPAPPVLATAPTVRGDTTVGSTLTADPGSWSDPAATFAYAWQRCDDTGSCTTIDGAAGSTYLLTGDDVGLRIAVAVTAAGGGGTTTAVSVPSAPVTAPVPVPPAPNGVPTLSGAPTVGSTLTADPGSWSDPAATFAYAWQRCDDTGSCTTIDGAAGSTYLLTGDDTGLQIRVEVTATGVQGTIGSADSTPVGPVVVPAPPALVTAPGVGGDATVGSTLTADPGSWSGPPPTFAYAWQECDGDGTCRAIDGATESTYALTAADLGRQIRIEVTATNAGGTGSADSATVTVALPPPPAVLTAPSVTGDATVGSTLTADPGSWSGPTTTPTFSWQRCDADGTCSRIARAESATYTITNDDRDQRIRVRVTAANAGGKSVADSAATDPVTLPDPPSVVTAPGVSGDASVGATLTATPGSWTGPPPAITYIWQRCDDTGSCSAVADATGATYALTEGDVGLRLRVQVTASNAGGSGTSQSATTEAVAGPPGEPTSPEPGDASPEPDDTTAGTP